MKAILSFLQKDREDMAGLIYIYRKSDGSWIEPQNLGSEINKKYHERFPGVSPDGKYLFFTRPNGENNGNIYWINAKIIEELKPIELK